MMQPPRPFSLTDNVPPRLRAANSTLAEIAPDRQKIKYVPESWAKRLGNDDPDLAALVLSYPGSITRGDLSALAAACRENDALLRRLFLATMLWGFGPNGRGAWRTAKMLADPRLEVALSRAWDRVRRGDLYTAYEDFRISWCGPAFLTKFLYVAGLGLGSRPLPLVLDSRVANALDTLEADGSVFVSHFLTRLPGGAVGWNPAGWVRFVETTNRWADDLGCSADAIEMLLFEPPPAFLDFRVNSAPFPPPR